MCQLDNLERGVWGERRWLDDDGVAGKQGWDDLSEGQDDWEVLGPVSDNIDGNPSRQNTYPWADRSYDTERSVARSDHFLVVLNAVLWDIQRQVMLEERVGSLDLELGKLFLEQILACGNWKQVKVGRLTGLPVSWHNRSMISSAYDM